MNSMCMALYVLAIL